MHVVTDAQRMPTKKRRLVEKVFVGFGLLVTMAQFTLVLILLTQVVNAGPKTYGRDVFINKDYELGLVLDAKTKDCPAFAYTMPSYMGFTDVPVVLDAQTQSLAFAEFGDAVRFMMILAGVAFCIGFMNRQMVRANVYEVRIKGVTLHKEILTLLDIAVNVLTFLTALDAERVAKMLRAYLEHCKVKSTSSLPFKSPFVLLYATCGVVAGYFLIGFCIHGYFGLTQPPSPPDMQDAATRGVDPDDERKTE